MSAWDREWFSHFSQGGLETIEWVEIENRPDVLAALRAIHLPGRVEGESIFVIGYGELGDEVVYL